MEVSSDASAKHLPVPITDKHGRAWLAVIAKWTFRVDPTGRVERDEDGAEPDLADTYNGPDGASASIRRPSQLFEYKPGTDVVLIGHAHPPLRGNVDHVDVALRVGHLSKTVRAWGLRVWKAGTLAGLAPGPARPLREPVPLVYELAWGGLDLSDPASPVGEWRNTVGRGVSRTPRRLVDQPAAQLEDPARPIGSGSNVPASFGAIHRHWAPRKEFAGTYDEAWSETKAPLLPDDFDPRFHVCVPHDQWSATPLRGDEPIEVRGATPEGLWRFALPRVAPGFSSITQGRRAEHRTHLDTVLIDADAGRVELTWRAAVPLPDKYQKLEQVLVFEKDVHNP
jgi:hypothetical protein